MRMVVVREVVIQCQQTAVECLGQRIIHADDRDIEILTDRNHLCLTGEAASCAVNQDDDCRFIREIEEALDDALEALFVHDILVVIDREFHEHDIRILRDDIRLAADQSDNGRGAGKTCIDLGEAALCEGLLDVCGERCGILAHFGDRTAEICHSQLFAVFRGFQLLDKPAGIAHAVDRILVELEITRIGGLLIGIPLVFLRRIGRNDDFDFALLEFAHSAEQIFLHHFGIELVDEAAVIHIGTLDKIRILVFCADALFHQGKIRRADDAVLVDVANDQFGDGFSAGRCCAAEVTV